MSSTIEHSSSVEALRYLWINWRILGIHPWRRFRCLYEFYAIVMDLFSAYSLPLTMVVNLFYAETMERLVGNLYTNLTISAVTVKHLLIAIRKKDLLTSHRCLDTLDEYCKDSPEGRQHVKMAIKQCHILYWSYTAFYTMAAVFIVYGGLSSHQLALDGWFPSVSQNEEVNFYLTTAYQNGALIFNIFRNVTNDVYPLCYVNLLIGHVRALAIRIKAIGQKKDVSVEENTRELVRCIQNHKDVLSYFDCISPVISTTMFVQFLITCAVLCITAVKFVMFDRGLSEWISTGTYLIALIIEIFPCCIYVNTLMFESDQLTTALYHCNWYEQNQRFRKILITFMQRSQKVSVIMAGNLVPVTLQTFLAVIRLSFSMFTILNKMKI